MRRLFGRALMVVPALLATALLLTACSDYSQDEGTPSRTYKSGWFESGDGRSVWCIRYGSGLSCDWENATNTYIE